MSVSQEWRMKDITVMKYLSSERLLCRIDQKKLKGDKLDKAASIAEEVNADISVSSNPPGKDEW